ncbi:MAG: PAS domain S-box protein [Bacteroidota bacterium]
MDIKKKLDRYLKKLDISSLTDDQATQLLDVFEKKNPAKKNQGTNILFLFEKFFEYIPYAIAVCDSKGRIVKANKFFIELFEGEPVPDLCIFDHPVLKKAGYDKQLEKARNGEYVEIPELWYDVADYIPDIPSKKTCIKSISFAIFDKLKKITNYIIIFEDISDKKTIEAEFQKSAEKYKRIFENIQDVYYESTLEGILIELSPSVESFSKYKREDLIGKNILHLYADVGDREIMLNLMREKGFIRNYLLRLNDKDGSILSCSVNSRLLFDENKNPVRIIGSMTDISGYLKTLEALKISEEKYREIFENATEMVWTSDLEGNILTINPALEKHLGYKFEELDRNQFHFFLTDESYQRAYENQKYKIEHPYKSTIYEVEAIAKNGTHVFLEVSSFLKYKNNKPFAIFGIARNITERKKMEEELKESEMQYRALFESSRDAIMTLEPPSWRFTSGNQSTVEMFLAKDEVEFTSNEPWKLSPEFQPDGRTSDNKAKEMISIAMQNGSHFFEWTHKRLNGEDFLATVLLTRMNVQGKKFLQATVRDITDMKKGEEALKISEEKYMELFELSNDIIYTMDFRGNFTSVNRTVEKLLGLKFQELSDVNVKTYLTPESARRALADVVKKLRGRDEGTVYEVDFINVNGRIVTFEINSQVHFKNGKPFEVFGIARDVTERKKANEAIKNSEEKYKMIFENAPLGIMTADISGNIIEINPVLLQMLGSKSVNETKSINVLSFPPMIMAGLVEKFVKCIETGESVVSEHTYTSKWGKSLDTRIYTKPIKNSRDRITGFQTIVEDITEQKKTEKQIISALNEKEVLIREIHHRVKNNMQIIISLINMQMQDSRDAVMNRKFRELQHRVRSMSIIHEDLYMSDDLSRINFGNYLEHLTNHLLQAYPHKKNLQLHFNVSNILLGIDTAIPCGLIVNELLSNSLKYAFPDDCFGSEKPCEIFVEFSIEKNRYKLIIGDNGVGLPPNIEEIKSKSLGLLLVEILVTQLKGKMKMSGKKGTRYEIEMEKEKVK